MTKTNLHNLLLTLLLSGAGLFHEAAAQVVNPRKVDSSAVKGPVQQVKGIITDAATKKGLAGVKLSVKDFSATITDDQGGFTLNVPSFDIDVMIVAEGHEAKQVSLKGNTILNVSMLSESAVSFQEEVILPFGVVKKRNTTAAVVSYDANSEWHRPFETPDAALQGKVSGLNVIRRSGTPGVGANLFLRGYNSLYGTNAPLLVLDGIIYDANDYGTSIIANNFTNPLALVNVQDIDNYTVLKDASSIYGTKGANGAIIISTTRVKDQATSIDFGMYSSFNEAPPLMPVMNAYQYRIYLNEMLQSKGMSAADIGALPYMNDDTASNPDYFRYHNNTNWQRNIFRNSMNQNYYLKVTGGDNIATYALSVGYTKNEGVIRNTDMTRYNTRFNANFNFSKKLTGIANLAFTYNESNLKYQGVVDKTAPVYLALTKSPFLAPNEVNEKGILSPNFEDTDILGNYCHSLLSYANTFNDSNIYEKSKYYLELYIEKNQDDPSALVNYGFTLYKLATFNTDMQKYQDCLIILEKLIKLGQSDNFITKLYVNTLIRIASLNNDEKFYEKAFEHLTTLIKDDPYATYDLACYYSVRKRFELAKKYLLDCELNGYLPKSGHNHLVNDEDLSNLKNEQWFIELLERLKEKELKNKAA